MFLSVNWGFNVMETKILGVAGSLRKESHSAALLGHVLEQAQGFGAKVRMLDLREVDLPLLKPDQSHVGRGVDRVRGDVAWANSFLLASPDYHGSMSGTIKNFLDYFWEEFSGRLFGYIVSSHEKGLTVQDQMRTAVRQCYGWSLPYGIGFNGDTSLTDQAEIKSEYLAGRVRMLARDLTVYGVLLAEQLGKDLDKSPRDPGFAQSLGL